MFNLNFTICHIFINSSKNNKFTLFTQKQNNADYTSKLTEYNQAQQNYQRELTSWRNSHSDPINPNGVSTSEVQQQLSLGREPNASYSIATSHLHYGLNPKDVAGTEIDSSKGTQIWLTNSEPGTIATVTYTNLNNSYYTDSNGNKEKISKIVRTFSDGSIENVTASIVDGKKEHRILVFNDPTDGFWYNGLQGVTVTDQYFDVVGNPITISNNTGYLAVTSLNAWYGDKNAITLTGPSRHVEQVTPMYGGKAIALLGSSITNNGGSLYATKTNSDDVPASTWKGPGKWDNKGENEYYGSGLISLYGNSFSLRFSCQRGNFNDGNNTVWATMTTIIPETPGPKYKGPKKPEPKSSSIHYHYDTNL